MTINDLSVPFQHLEREKLLSDWVWLIGKSKLPILITKAGDAFVQDTESKAVYFLDVVEGKLDEVASDGKEFTELLGNVEFVMEKFSVDLIAPILKGNSKLPDGCLYGWKMLPVIGGEFSTENLEPTEIQVHFSISGQIWSQSKDLPEGTNITGFTTIESDEGRK